MRRSIALLLCLTLLFGVISLDAQAISNLFTSDAPIETNISRNYKGRLVAPDIIKNLQFSDVPAKHWANEAIVRLGALDIVKGYSYNGVYKYFPDNSVSNQEALAFIIRALGMEANAQQEAKRIALQQQQAGNTEILDLWSRGYLVVANQLGLITGAELADALQVDQALLDPTLAFMRSAPAEREQVAEWIVKGLNVAAPTALLPISGQQRIYTYNDWQQISVDKLESVEAILVNSIMGGFPDGSFKPHGSINRAQMAQTLKNMDDIYFGTQNMVQKTGIVVDIQEVYSQNGTTATKEVKYRILDENGEIEEVTYKEDKNTTGIIYVEDVVVYRDGKVAGLQSLKSDDVVEYLVDQDTQEMLYVYDRLGVTEQKTIGTLQPLNNLITDGYITVEDDNGKKFKFKVAKVIYGTDSQGINYINVDGVDMDFAEAPVEDKVALTIANGVVTAIRYEGQKALYEEVSGVVTDISPALGYITIIDDNGNEVTKNFFKNQVTVEKQNYYEDEDEVGYYDQVFPYFKFDPVDSSLSKIEPGDSVTMKLDDQGNVNHIYAKGNYTMYYGKIEFIAPKGAYGSKVHVALEDGTRTILDMPKEIPTFKSNKQVGLSLLQVGDWAKILVNQAVIEPGYAIISPKEVIIDSANYLVTNIYRGQISYFNDIQNTLTIQDTTTLSKMGWINYEKGKTLTLSDEVAYYYGEEQVSKDYVEHFLGFNGDVYIAVEEYFGDEKVNKVTFRQGIDHVIESDTVVYSDGVGKFLMDGYKKFITTDPGTIIVRNGRLVDAQNIMVPDYAQVVLNGTDTAVVDISKAPITDNVKIYRGRIKSIKEGVAFTVKSHAELKDMTWTFSPVNSSYTIDYRTKYIDDKGVQDMSTFIDYTQESKVDDVYSIFVVGNHAEYIVGQPYVKDGLRGEIYSIKGDTISLRDTYYYDKHNGSWKDFSSKNQGSEVTVDELSVIIRNGEFIDVNELEPGDKLRVLTDTELMSQFVNQGKRDVKGFIILVEG